MIEGSHVDALDVDFLAVDDGNIGKNCIVGAFGFLILKGSHTHAALLFVVGGADNNIVERLFAVAVGPPELGIFNLKREFCAAVHGFGFGGVELFAAEGDFRRDLFVLCGDFHFAVAEVLDVEVFDGIVAYIEIYDIVQTEVYKAGAEVPLVAEARFLGEGTAGIADLAHFVRRIFENNNKIVFFACLDDVGDVNDTGRVHTLVFADTLFVQADVRVVVDALEYETHLLACAFRGNGEGGLIAPEAVCYPFAEKGVLLKIGIGNDSRAEKIVVNASGNTCVDCGSYTRENHAGFHGCAHQGSERPCPCDFPVVFQKNLHNLPPLRVIMFFRIIS